MADIEIQCIDCPTKFTFTEGEQKFYQDHDYAQPKRCKTCRAAKKARNNQVRNNDAGHQQHSQPTRTQWVGGDASGGGGGGDRRDRKRDRDRGSRRRDSYDD